MAARPDSVASDFTKAINTPLPHQNDDGLHESLNTFLDTPHLFQDSPSVSLVPPRAPYVTSEFSTPRESSYVQSPNNSAQLLQPAADKSEGDDQADEAASPPAKRRSPILLALYAVIALILIVLLIILPVYFSVVKHKHHDLHSSTSGSTSPAGTPSTGNPKSPTGATSGGDGSTVITDDGTSFTYTNKFGGYWVHDPNDPFNNNARPNSWTPPLNTSWTWGKDRIFGVNLGGLFVLEPFISPALFQKYPTAIDEWSLSTLMAADTASGGLSQLENHYNTFVTEQDIAQMAGAGLNWIRLPIPYWAIDTWPGEPFLAKTSWKYIVRLFGWARKYGMRINLDLHTVPGSQNGYNHSGKYGLINFLYGVMGIANAQRTLNYIRIITEFISQDQYKDVVPMFGVLNEPIITTIGQNQLGAFYLEAYNIIRGITGFGQGNGPFISIHDGFGPVTSWAGFLAGSDRIALDTHPYFAFNGAADTSPIDTGTGPTAGGVWPGQACTGWGATVNQSQTAFGVTFAGEFSSAINDCGLYVEGVQVKASYGGDCSTWEDATAWSAGKKAGLLQFTLASMDALQNWFFWTWKVGNSSVTNTVQAPLWSYQLGLENGFVPLDPRDSVGVCAALGVSGSSFGGTYQPWQTGGAGAGTISPSATAAYGQWPPTNVLGANGGIVPTYTSTGTVATLPPPTLTPKPTKSVDVGDGWFNAQDTASAPTAIAGCQYPDSWNPAAAVVPANCGMAVVAAPAPAATTTALPVPAAAPATVPAAAPATAVVRRR